MRYDDVIYRRNSKWCLRILLYCCTIIYEVAKHMRRRLSGYKTLTLLSITAFLIFILILPQNVYAWSAIDSVGVVDLVKGNLNTHEIMLKLAYEFLSKDPAFDQDLFPKRNSITDWEGVIPKQKKVNNVGQFGTEIYLGYIWGADSNGGPDAGGRSRESEHYFNPDFAVMKGGAPSSVQKHFAELLRQMYQPDRKRDQGATSVGAQDAAWSAHYTADMFVPYHTVGFPASQVPSTEEIRAAEIFGPSSIYHLSKAEAGDDILWAGPKKPIDSSWWSEGWGKEGDFSEAMIVFNRFREDDPEHVDWFDPWYYNGMLSHNARKAFGSHAQWEEKAHTYLRDGNLLIEPTRYSRWWENAEPSSFDSLEDHLKAQAEKAARFTILNAANTRENTAYYYSHQDAAANGAIEAIATLWRASISALKPKVRVEPVEPKGSNRYRAVGTVSNVAKEIPTDVKVKITVDGGKIIDKDPIRIIKSLADPIEWQIETTDINNCQVIMEVIGKFSQTPDLGYASFKAEKPTTMTLTLDPSRVELPRDGRTELAVKIKVNIDPPKETELKITQKSLDSRITGKPLDLLSGLFHTKADGSFVLTTFVDKKAADGKYEIQVEAPKLGIKPATATLQIGKQASLDFSRVQYCNLDYDIEGNVQWASSASWDWMLGHFCFKGSFTGNEFNGDLQPQDFLGRSVYEHKGGSGKIKVTVMPTADPNVYEITGYVMETTVPYGSGTRATKIIGDKISLKAKYREDYNSLSAEIGGTEACKYITRFNTLDKYIVYGKPASRVCETFRCSKPTNYMIFQFLTPQK